MPPTAAPARSNILPAKFLRPRLPDSFIPRPRLIEQLNRGLSGPLTLVCASAGFGKTTLVSSWIAELESNPTRDAFVPAAWLSLDAGDSNLTVFVRNVVAAVRTIFPDACPDTYALVTAPRPAPVDELAATLNNEISSLPQRFILVLDEYEVIRGRAVHDLLERPDASLAAPAAPGADLSPQPTPTPTRSARQGTAHRAAHARSPLHARGDGGLRHARLLQAPLSDTVLQKLESLNEGWIAGLQVASLSLRRTGNADEALASLSGSQRDLSDFLADEVLSRQPRPLQMFMLKTSILDSFCAGLCDAVAGGDSATADGAGSSGLRSNAPISSSLPSMSSGQWYRYHALFRDMLQSRLAMALDESEIADLHRRAARWLAQHGLVDDALRHALDAHDLDLAATIMERRMGYRPQSRGPADAGAMACPAARRSCAAPAETPA